VTEEKINHIDWRVKEIYRCMQSSRNGRECIIANSQLVRFFGYGVYINPIRCKPFDRNSKYHLREFLRKNFWEKGVNAMASIIEDGHLKIEII